jgi:hypothetical protein
MADWKQIQARIRKAKNSADPKAKLGELFEKTRDAMVAWELGAIEEVAGVTEEAIRWYTTAAERFRRAEWKKKAEEALVRLGAPVPEKNAVPREESPRAEAGTAVGEEPARPGGPAQVEAPAEEERQFSFEVPAVEPPAYAAATESPAQPLVTEAAAATAVPGSREGVVVKGRRRRGRRGGRGRRRGRGGEASGLPATAFVTPPPAERAAVARPPREKPPERVRREKPVEAVEAEPEPVSHLAERLTHGRPGEPALASRLAHLEAQLRRLLSSPLHLVDEADEAPAGPGVYLLTDSDLITAYYVENCKTLRVALGQLARGGRGSRGAQKDGSVRSRLADHLGISDAKVSHYLKEHCRVRWMQLDEEAPNVAHFAIAVLKPALNDE